jgi:hypothetical protein
MEMVMSGRLATALVATATVGMLAFTAAPAHADIVGAKDGSIFLAVAHDGGILHDATVSTDQHFPIDKFSLEGPGLQNVPDHSGAAGIWRFDLTGHTVTPGSRICGTGVNHGVSIGRACITI